MHDAERTVYTFDGESFAVEISRVGAHAWRASAVARGHYLEGRGLTPAEALQRWAHLYAALPTRQSVHKPAAAVRAG